MARARIEIESVELLQLSNLLQRRRTEGSFPIESMQHDALQDIAESHVVEFGERFENLQDSFFDTHAGLGAFDFELWVVGHVYQCTMVH